MTKNKKDICENNYIVRWSLSLGLFIFGVLTLTILFIDYEVLRDPNVIHNDHLRIIGVVGAAFITLFCVHRFVTLLGRHLNKVYLSRFNEIKELGYLFKGIDKNGDGVLTVEEIKNGFIFNFLSFFLIFFNVSLSFGATERS